MLYSEYYALSIDHTLRMGHPIAQTACSIICAPWSGVTPPTSWSVQNVCDYIGIVTGVTKESVELARNANLNGLQFLNQTDADILRLVNDNHIDANELYIHITTLRQFLGLRCIHVTGQIVVPVCLTKKQTRRKQLSESRWSTKRRKAEAKKFDVYHVISINICVITGSPIDNILCTPSTRRTHPRCN